MPKSIVSIFRHNKTSALAEISHDRRTITSTQKAAAAAAENYKPKEIAGKLGISYQKWGAVNKKIQAGEIYSPEIRDKLNQIAEGEAKTPAPVAAPARPIEKLVDYYVLPDEARPLYFPDYAALQKMAPWVHIEKTEIDLDAMREYFAQSPAEYFVIARQESKAQKGKYTYHFVDVRTVSELAKKGSVSGTLRFYQKLDEFGKEKRWREDEE